jgi:hypothetical protein
MGGDIPDSPLGAKGLSVPLGRREFAEQRQQVGSLFLREGDQVRFAHEASSPSRVMATYLLR